MKNTIIYLLGFPGTGKYTIAKEVCKQADVKLVDNHLINNPVFALIGDKGKTLMPPVVWDQTAKVRAVVLDTMKTLSPPDYSFVFTNVLIENDPVDREIYEAIENTAIARKATFIPVRLICEIEENMQRITHPDRKLHMKTLHPETARKFRENHEIMQTNHPNELTLDVTNLQPQSATQIILNHTKNCQKT